MLPRLPPELIAHIQALAEEAEPGPSRQRLRAKFELVSREWHSLVDHFTHLVVLRLSDIDALTGRGRGRAVDGLLAGKTREVRVELNGLNEAYEVGRVGWLLGRCGRAEVVELVVGGRGLGLGLFGREGSNSALVDGLAGLRHVRHFTSTTPPYNYGPGLFTALDQINTYVNTATTVLRRPTY